MPSRRELEDCVGTCQLCFGDWKVDAGTRQIVEHGYTLPGDGERHGVCFGSTGRHFEHSCDLTIRRLATCQEDIVEMGQELDDLAAGRILFAASAGKSRLGPFPRLRHRNQGMAG